EEFVAGEVQVSANPVKRLADNLVPAGSRRAAAFGDEVILEGPHLPDREPGKTRAVGVAGMPEIGVVVVVALDLADEVQKRRKVGRGAGSLRDDFSVALPAYGDDLGAGKFAELDAIALVAAQQFDLRLP